MAISARHIPQYAEVYPIIRVEFLILGLVSFGCSCVLLLLSTLLPRTRRTPGWLQLRAAVCEAVVSACFVALYFFGRAELRTEEDADEPKNPLLWVLLLTLSAFEVAANAWRLLMYLDLVTIYRNPFAPDRYRPLYPVLVGLLSISAVSASYMLVTRAGPHAEQAELQVLAVGFVFFPFAIFVGVGGSLYMLVRLLVLSALRGAMRDGHPPSITFLARQRVMRHGTAYLLLHGSQLSVAVVLLLLLLYSNVPRPFAVPSSAHASSSALWHVLAVIVCARPTVSFVGWLVINDVFYLFLGTCSFTKPWFGARPALHGNSQPVQSNQSNWFATQQLLLAVDTTSSADASARKPTAAAATTSATSTVGACTHTLAPSATDFKQARPACTVSTTQGQQACRAPQLASGAMPPPPPLHEWRPQGCSRLSCHEEGTVSAMPTTFSVDRGLDELRGNGARRAWVGARPAVGDSACGLCATGAGVYEGGSDGGGGGGGGAVCLDHGAAMASAAASTGKGHGCCSEFDGIPRGYAGTSTSMVRGSTCTCASEPCSPSSALPASSWFARLTSAFGGSSGGVDEVGFKEEVRFELVYDVAVGIGELAAVELRMEAAATQEVGRASFDLGTLDRESRLLSWLRDADHPRAPSALPSACIRPYFPTGAGNRAPPSACAPLLAAPQTPLGTALAAAAAAGHKCEATSASVSAPPSVSAAEAAPNVRDSASASAPALSAATPLSPTPSAVSLSSACSFPSRGGDSEAAATSLRGSQSAEAPAAIVSGGSVDALSRNGVSPPSLQRTTDTAHGLSKRQNLTASRALVNGSIPSVSSALSLQDRSRIECLNGASCARKLPIGDSSRNSPCTSGVGGGGGRASSVCGADSSAVRRSVSARSHRRSQSTPGVLASAVPRPPPRGYRQLRDSSGSAQLLVATPRAGASARQAESTSRGGGGNSSGLCQGCSGFLPNSAVDRCAGGVGACGGSHASLPPPSRFASCASSYVPSPPISRSQSEGLLRQNGLAALDGLQPRSAALHYEVDAFRTIRQSFGVTSAMYAHAFPHDLSELGSRWRQRLKESMSEGASGSFFYRVLSSARGDTAGPSSRFIVKQITEREKRTLMAMLPAYLSYVQSRRGRSLIQYFGCHSMQLRWQFSGKVYFVVMRNFMPTRAWLTFDLKGATANRRALAAKFLHAVHSEAQKGCGSAYGTLRDWEWLDIAMVVDVPEADKASLSEMVASDARFLRSQGCLDYSLFVGIHRLPQALHGAARCARLAHLASQGGYVSLDQQKVYFFGIIDVLERYTMRWQCQRAVLTAGYHLLLRAGDADGISALPPADYADRFHTFVVSEVLQVPNLAQHLHGGGVGGSTLHSTGEWQLRETRRAKHSGRGGSSCCACLSCCCCRCCARGGDGVHGSLESEARWGRLWQRRRRGLVKERIDVERADHMRRIDELEHTLRAWAQRQQAPAPSAG